MEGSLYLFCEYIRPRSNIATYQQFYNRFYRLNLYNNCKVILADFNLRSKNKMGYF